MGARIMRRLVRPVVVPLGVAAVLAAIIISIGEILLRMHKKGTLELERPELMSALGLALLILAVCAFITTRPVHADSILDRQVAIGDRPIFAAELPPVDVAARNGPLGTVDDIQPGDMLYARSGALARVVGLVSGTEEFGRRHRAYLYAAGVHGASDELWVPVEAVMAVYPQTHSVFLAIKGDETESFGWNRPPEHFRRTPREETFL